MVLAGAAFAARAQSPAPPPAPVPDKGAMERALQQADGPRRRILEAARSKNAVKPEATAPAPAEALPPARPAHAAPPSASRPAPREESPSTPITVIVTLPGAPQPVVVPDRGKVEEVPGVAAPEKLAEPVPLVELAPAPEGAASAPESAAPPPSAPPVVALPVLAPEAAAPRPAPPPAERTAANGAPPRLLSKVEPELPQRLLRRGLLRTEVLVNLVINPDGSVRDVAVQSTGNAQLDGAVTEAVRQWRYDTQAAPRPYQLMLVLSPS